MKNSRSTLAKFLRKIVKDAPHTIESEVASWLLTTEDPVIFLRDLLNNGCRSGIVPHLVYYTDTHVFCDKHYDQIMDLYWGSGVSIPKQVDVKNYLAWFAFEAQASAIYSYVNY